jgi:hypothetical protein
MKKIVLVLLAVLLIPTHAFAYSFSVKVVNKTGGKLTVYNWVAIHVKGGTQIDLCDRPALPNTHLILENNEHGLYTDCEANVQKWQRAIRVHYSCDYPDEAFREVRYPKSKKWYDRDYATKNGDRYTILVKKKDC